MLRTSLTPGLVVVLEGQAEGSPLVARWVDTVSSACWMETKGYTSLLLPSSTPDQRGKDRGDRGGTGYRNCVL